jgi:hypothetical protein
LAAPFFLIALLCGGSDVRAAGLSSYRDMRLGMELAEAAEVAGTTPTTARTLHTRPAVIQEMSWLFYPSSGAGPAKADPVRDGTLIFFNGELCRIVVTYDRYKVEGMTAEDMIEGISAVYGLATRPGVEIAYHSIYGEAAGVLARWEDADASYNLVETDYSHSFALIVYSKKVDALAQTAIAESLRLDELEAPRRALDQQAARDRESKLELDKARLENKPNFRP